MTRWPSPQREAAQTLVCEFLAPLSAQFNALRVANMRRGRGTSRLCKYLPNYHIVFHSMGTLWQIQSETVTQTRVTTSPDTSFQG